MGADIKKLRTRIKSVDSTLHLTKAMELVASSKIRRACDTMAKGIEYASAVNDIIDLLCTYPECGKSPYMRDSEGNTRLIVIAGDRGLAGGYNANVFRLEREYPGAAVIPIGKRACDVFGADTVTAENFTCSDAAALAQRLCSDFAGGKYSKLGIICTRYVSAMTQIAETRWILPLHLKDGGNGDSIFEPDVYSVFNDAVLKYVSGNIMASVRESFASEVAARRMAMDSAGKNAKKMMDDLRLEYNRARQGDITQEITEIVAGSGS